MANSVQPTPASKAGPVEQFDAIIIGAGISGLYQLIRVRELGLTVRVYEAGSGVGGTWNRNRYLGARFDSESRRYGYSFSKELLQEWDWKEHFSCQPENERYLNCLSQIRPAARHHVQCQCRRSDLRRKGQLLGSPPRGWHSHTRAV